MSEAEEFINAWDGYEDKDNVDEPTTVLTPEQKNTKLKVIYIVDDLIHSITRYHIPDYPEADKAVQQLLSLLNEEKIKELEPLLVNIPNNVTDYATKISDRLQSLEQQSKETKDE